MTVRICIAGSLWKREGSHAAWSFLRSTVNDREADDDMRVFAIQRLCESATNEVLSFFRELVTTGKDEHVEGAAFDALARHGDVQDLALLRKLARRTEDDDERSHKMKSISRMEIRLEGMKGNPRPAH